MAFVVATTSWIMSLTVNLNPLMRFDGYYLLADGLGLPNLQDRAFAFGQWRLRELLFAPGVPAPEAVGPSTRRTMVAYAWAIWVYRLILFTGIAVMVYHYFFKLLGIVLFLVEILFFIGLPIWRELTAWWSRRAVFAGTRRFALTVAATAGLVILACIPWPSRVAIPGLLQAKIYATVYPPASGKITAVAIRQGQLVREGDALLVLESPKLVKDAKLAQTQVDQLDFRLQRQAGYADDRAQARVIVQSLDAKLAELDGLTEQQHNLLLRAPIGGVISDQADSLHPGRWINEKLAVAYVIDPARSIVAALASVQDLSLLAPGQEAQFIPNDVTQPGRQVRVAEIRDADEQDFSVPYLASIYGGDVPARKDARGRVMAEQSVYRVELEVLDQTEPVRQTVTGQVHIIGKSESLLGRVWKRVVAVTIRESGF
jgi:putative peptide zinc metalloprotease protein